MNSSGKIRERISEVVWNKGNDLNFPLFEVVFFALAAALFAIISPDGELTWLEGLLLCAFYLILAVSTFFPPIA